MFKRLRIKNFKAWGEQLWPTGVELAPVTLLLGENSAGKTSILQVLLLLKQTFESPDRKMVLNLGGEQTDIVDLGNFSSIVHDHTTDGQVGIAFTLADTSPHPHPLDYEVVYSRSGELPIIQSLKMIVGDDTYALERQPKGAYLITGPGYMAPVVGNRPDAKRTYAAERSLAFSAESLAELGVVGELVQDLSLQIRNAFSAIAYLGPLREQPARTYLWSGAEPSELGKRGQYAVHALLASENDPRRPKEGKEGGQRWLVGKVAHWLRKLGVADDLVLSRQGRSRHYEVEVVRQGKRANLIDVGFGVSQVLPMVVLAYVVPRGTIIIAEQPEIHLHPRAQGALAELLVEVAKERSVQFLVETHSEHLFRRLQFLVADEQVSADQCRLYFAGRDATGEAALERLEMDDFGRILNWPQQFFGDSIGDTERQMRRFVERSRAAREGVGHG